MTKISNTTSTTTIVEERSLEAEFAEVAKKLKANTEKPLDFEALAAEGEIEDGSVVEVDACTGMTCPSGNTCAHLTTGCD